jgi:anti-anti-sigma factor
MIQLEQTQVDGVRILRLSGTLNQECVDNIQPEFRTAACEGGPVVVDLGGVDVINTPGLAILIAANRDVKQAGGRMVITQANERIDDALRRCLLHRILTLEPEFGAAVKKAKTPN